MNKKLPHSQKSKKTVTNISLTYKDSPCNVCDKF